MPGINLNFLQQLARRPRFAANAALNLVEIRGGRTECKTDPTMLQIEVTSRCNFRCSYCIVHNGTETGAVGDMSLDLFKQILDRFPLSYYLQLHGQGEPLLHPELAKMVAYADEQKRFSSIVSNGSLWTESRSKELLDAGVDVIAISLDLAEPHEMEADRLGLKYDRVVDTIARLLSWRDIHRPLTAVGVSAVVKRHILEQPEELHRHVKRLDDLGIDFLFVGPLAGTSTYRSRYPSEFLSEIIPQNNDHALIPFSTHCTVYETPATNFVRNRCMWPWMALYVNFDGSLSYCSNNHRIRVGSFNDDDARNLETHRDLRAQFVDGHVPVGCSGCQYLLALHTPFKGDDSTPHSMQQSDLVTISQNR